ncbi:DEKNAAC101204 [Brettanomyces naardenensis]|uniref:Protein phosphatase n=1 Tax=Brettanomyces naardenensis TaxID=13370 RepID=A0A448YHL6_BRENA|nr:DEKNAAC101204 [Brettanomyces naardenensis]
MFPVAEKKVITWMTLGCHGGLAVPLNASFHTIRKSPFYHSYIRPGPSVSIEYRLVWLHYRSIGSTSGFSEDAFNRFRSFHNGDQFTKQFTEGAAQFTASVAYSPKSRPNSIINNEQREEEEEEEADDDDDEDDGKSGEFVSGFKKMVQGSKSKGLSPAATSPTGEDNYIIGYTDSGLILGVLDGVGGWAEQGYDSSAISRELAAKITKIYLEGSKSTPAEILDDAFRQVKDEGKVDVGSTTVSFGLVDAKTRKLEAVNLGDSWFGVFRKQDNGRYKCFYQSKEQTYYFNAPYQLSIIPQKLLKEAEKSGTKYLINVPEDADRYSVQLEPQDVVIFTTDGMVDNVFPEDLEIYLDDSLKEEASYEDLGEIGKVLVSKVVVLARNPNFNSVFSQRLSKITGQDYIGGKPDDVTAVMMYVSKPTD